MASNQEDGTGALKALLSEMPNIAKAVNAFSSETVQQQAFAALLDALTGEAPREPPGAGAGGEPDPKRAAPKTQRRRTAPAAGGTTSTRRRRGGGGPKQVLALDLTPKGKKSLADFVRDKDPKTNHDRNVVSVFYLESIAQKTPVTVDDVYTCYLRMNWRIPKNFLNSLAVTSSKKAFIDTSNGDDLKVAPAGLNHVNHDLPAAQKG